MAKTKKPPVKARRNKKTKAAVSRLATVLSRKKPTRRKPGPAATATPAVFQPPISGPPQPAAVVWIEEERWDFPVSLEPAGGDITTPAILLPQQSVAQDSLIAEAVVQTLESLDAPMPQRAVMPEAPEEATPNPAAAASAMAFDVFGNLVFPPKPSEFSQDPAEGEVAVSDVAAALEPDDPWSAIDAPDAAAARSPQDSRQSDLPFDRVQKLTVVGVLWTAFWPLRMLYWPVRLRHLQHQSKVLQQHYSPDHGGSEPISAAAEHSPALRVVRVTLGFIAASAAMLLPIQIAVYTQAVSDASEGLFDESQAAISALRQGRDELARLQMFAATDSFHRAEEHFRRARQGYAQLDWVTKSLLKTLPQGRRSVAAGLSLLEAGEDLAEVANVFSAQVASAGQAEGFMQWSGLLPAVADFQANLTAVLPKVAQAKSALAEINLAKLPPANRESFLEATQALPDLEATLLDVTAVTRSILRVTGVQGWQRYLVLLQNNHELRATGGFLGSYAIVDVADGQVTNVELPGGGSYDLQGSLMALVSSPLPLRLINPRWEFQDANWWPDFPLTARKAAWFLEQSRGPSVDGVIAMTNTVVERILELTGPITLSESGRVLDAGNFTREAQDLAEFAYDKAENRPKAFLADVTPQLLERIAALPPDRQLALGAMLYQAIQEKHLMAYSADPQTQELLESLDWAGHQQPVGLSDYLMVVNSNIAGGKTDASIATSLYHAVAVEPDGHLTVSLTISRAHQGTPGDPFTGVSNNSYLRVYVPGGSELVSASGFSLPKGAVEQSLQGNLQPDSDMAAIEGLHITHPISGVDIYREQGKTVFAHWLTVKPGEQKSAQLVYRLPFTLAEANNVYTLLAQKQPGTLGDELLSSFPLPAGFVAAKSYPADNTPQLRRTDDRIQFHDRLVTDKFYGVKLEPEVIENPKPQAPNPK